jgi:hypothetical protein
VSLQIDTQGFDAFLRSLEAMSGKPRTQVLLDQTRVVLETCVKRSPGKGGKEIENKARLRVLKPARYVDESGTLVPANNRVPRRIEKPFLQTLTGTRGGQAGRQWYVSRDRKGQRRFLAGEWLERWAKFQRIGALRGGLLGKLDPRADRAALAVGSIKASWLDAGRKLGIEVKAPAFVRKARSAFHDGARSRSGTEGATSFVEIANTNSALIRLYDGGSILAGAVQTRLAFFERAVRNDWFDDVKFRAKNFPGIFVSA